MKKETSSTIVVILLLSVAWLYFNRNQSTLLFYLVEIPYFIVFSGMLFTIGTPLVSQGLRYGTKTSLAKTLIFPFFLLVLYYLYIVVNGQPFMEGASLLLPYLVLFPVLALYSRTHDYKFVNWWDLVVFLVFLWPVTLVDLPERSNLPTNGISFDSVYRMMIILVAVYAFVVIRRLQGVGFWVDASWRKLWTTVWVWLLYIGLVLLLGNTLGALNYGRLELNDLPQWEKIVTRFLTIYLHTALFEELFFRGLLQNILSKKIRQTPNPLIFWVVGSSVLVTLSLVTGSVMKDQLFWFPMVITILIFVFAYVLSNFFVGFRHHYLALAISSVLFGLVHFHAGSVVYVGFAIVAGWAYGYVYWKTKNVFYAALIHTLVNISPMILGIELIQ